MAGSVQDLAPDGIMGAAISTVIEQMDKIDTFAEKYQAQLNGALQDIKNVSVAPVDPYIRIGIPETPVPILDFGNQPVLATSPLTYPDLPSFNNIEHLLADLDLDDLQIPDAPEMPAIQMPSAPGVAVLDQPLKPNVSTDLELPKLPELQMPELDQLVQLQIPEFQFPELADFDGKPPSLDSIAVPNVFMEWREPTYESALLNDIQQKVKAWMAGGTGLPAPIEDALFSRARSRLSRDTERAVQESINDWSSRNYSMPPGMLAKQAASIREQGHLQAGELNRDILIEASKMEIDNIRFMVERGIALEQIMVNVFNNTVNHLFETAKFNAESKISVFNAQVALFNAQNSAFESLTLVYKTKLEGAIAKLSAYKTAVDAQVALGQVNEQHVQVYKARIDAVLSNVELYKASMQGASVRADVIKNQFDAYRSEVQAFGEQINAEKIKVDAYEAQTRAESARVSMFEAQTRAYASTVQAVQSKASLKSDEIKLKMEAARTWIAKYSADMDGYKADLQTRLSEAQLKTSNFSAQVDAWRSSAGVEISHAEMQSRFSDNNTRTNIAIAEMQIKEYEAKIQKSLQEAQLALEQAKALGQYSAQLAAGAMSAAHVSASISGSGSASTSKSTSNSESHNYSY
ncbi:hypothetical protein [Acinetobacter tianfuensis]|uniref:Uncharacterized protein n=1 Tax=Acinetobacter tianfuensis TaxID=2419603 RepID=A0A3A8EJQ9_9GAMM|nr:hypothetical protein [Acinetobacter tianfuensis]RKG33726.1 hypothetical protein D7V32_02695 [Acinetobacter tianfuensis]